MVSNYFKVYKNKNIFSKIIEWPNLTLVQKNDWSNSFLGLKD